MTQSTELEAADLEALAEAKRSMDTDIQAGRFKPGDHRCVVVPSGIRFHLAHPEPYSPEPARPWWVRLVRSWLGKRI